MPSCLPIYIYIYIYIARMKKLITDLGLDQRWGEDSMRQQKIATYGIFSNIIGGILNNCAHKEYPRKPSMIKLFRVVQPKYTNKHDILL